MVLAHLVVLERSFLEQELAYSKTTAKHKATLTPEGRSVAPPAHPGKILWKQEYLRIWDRRLQRGGLLPEFGKHSCYFGPSRYLKEKMMESTS